jgi:hypothetical protein
VVYRRAQPTSAAWYYGSVEGSVSEVVRSHCEEVREFLLSCSIVDSPLSLPDVESDIHRNLKDVHVALHALQYNGPKDPLLEIHALLRQFDSRIHAAMNGAIGDPVQTASKAYRQFGEDIGRMTPRFRPWPREGPGAQDPFPEYPDKLRLRGVKEEKLTSHIVYLDEIVTRLEE